MFYSFALAVLVLFMSGCQSDQVYEESAQVTEATPTGTVEADAELIPAIFDPSGQALTESEGALLEAVNVERKPVSEAIEAPQLEINEKNYPALNRLKKEASIKKLVLTVPPESIDGPSAKIRCLLYVNTDGDFVNVEILKNDGFHNTSEHEQLLVDYLKKQKFPKAFRNGKASNYRTLRTVTLRKR